MFSQSNKKNTISIFLFISSLFLINKEIQLNAESEAIEQKKIQSKMYPCLSMKNQLFKNLCFSYLNSIGKLDNQSELQSAIHSLYTDTIFSKLTLLNPVKYGIRLKLIKNIENLKKSIILSTKENNVSKHAELMSNIVHNYNLMLLNLTLCDKDKMIFFLNQIKSEVNKNNDNFKFQYSAWDKIDFKSQCILGDSTIISSIYWVKKDASIIPFNRDILKFLLQRAEKLGKYKIIYILNKKDIKKSHLTSLNSELENNNFNTDNHEIYNFHDKSEDYYSILTLIKKI